MFQINGLVRGSIHVSSRALRARRNDDRGECLVDVGERRVNDDVELLGLSGLEEGQVQVHEARANHFADKIWGVDFSADRQYQRSHAIIKHTKRRDGL